MAISREEKQILWSSNNTITVNNGATQLSDAITYADTAWKVEVHAKCDNEGTPAAGDYVSVYYHATAGDPDGASTDEYASNAHGEFLGILDTNVEDPAQNVFDVKAIGKGGKVAFRSSAGTHTISATLSVKHG